MLALLMCPGFACVLLTYWQLYCISNRDDQKVKTFVTLQAVVWFKLIFVEDALAASAIVCFNCRVALFKALLSTGRRLLCQTVQSSLFEDLWSNFLRNYAVSFTIGDFRRTSPTVIVLSSFRQHFLLPHLSLQFGDLSCCLPFLWIFPRPSFYYTKLGVCHV